MVGCTRGDEISGAVIEPHQNGFFHSTRVHVSVTAPLLCVAAQHKSSRIKLIWMHTGRLLGEVDPGHARKIILLKWSGWG